MFDLVAAAGRNPEYQVTVEHTVIEQKVSVTRRRYRRFAVPRAELVPVNAYKIRIERIPDVPTPNHQPTNQEASTHAEKS